jgi:DNA polymerase-3 subunit delta'
MAATVLPEPDTDPLAPRRNASLIGHHSVEALLAQAAQIGRLPHAVLLGGPRGIGKATLAFRFARWLLAGGGEAGQGLFATAPPTDLHVAPTHPVAARIAAAGHADLLTVERQWDPKRKRVRGEIIAEDARGIADFFHRTSAEGGWRIALIDGAEEMNRTAANAILKILEEPPRRSLLLLVSHAPGRLLPTIRSRCRSILMQPLGSEEVSQLLAEHRPALDAGDRAALAAMAEGSIGRALDLADSGGLAQYRRLTRILDRLPALDWVEIHALADSVARGEDDAYRTLVDLLQDLLRRAAVSGAGGATDEDDAGRHLARIASAAGLDAWIDTWDALRAHFAGADALNFDRKQTLLDAFIRLERMAGWKGSAGVR